ncbi:brachyurin isoform X1 [Penaeus vannamei]|uniref:brachyurin isoform X1 n=1 Tax=Penaeus vannamei TaxID=6689 RepID=UPI00387F4AE6
MALVFAVLCVSAVAGAPDSLFAWIPPIKVTAVRPYHSLLAAHHRMVGGVEAEQYKHGYQATLIDRGQFFCGGVVISGRFILTAAHCVPEKNKTDLQVFVGAHRLEPNGRSRQILDVERAFVHPNYSLRAGVRSDIALLRLREEMDFNKRVFPIRLPTRDVAPHATLVVTGWGGDKPDWIPLLHEMKTKIIPLQACKASYPWVTRATVCALVPSESASTCSGDSGGPAVHEGRLVGLVSFGSESCSPSYPQGFTNVYFYTDWIKSFVNQTASGCGTFKLSFVYIVLVYLFLCWL